MLLYTIDPTVIANVNLTFKMPFFFTIHVNSSHCYAWFSPDFWQPWSAVRLITFNHHLCCLSRCTNVSQLSYNGTLFYCACVINNYPEGLNTES